MRLILAWVLVSLHFGAGSQVRPPSMGAETWLLYDVKSGTVIAGHRVHERVEPASMTKAMTAYVLFDEMRHGSLALDDKVDVSRKAYRADGSRTFLEIGSSVDIKTLLRGMIVQSGNDASIALAEAAAGEEALFADKMNELAKTLGMKDSHFVNSTGLPAEHHYTTPYDLAVLAKHLITEFPQYYSMFGERSMKYNNIMQHNRNRLLWRDPSVDGIKTGHTKSAGYCLLSSAERDGRRLVAVVTGLKSRRARTLESQKLLNYGFRFFDTRNALPAGSSQRRLRAWKGDKDTVDIGVLEDVFVTVPRKQSIVLELKINVQEPLVAPIKKGQPVGEITVLLEDKVLVKKTAVALHDVGRGFFFKRLIDQVSLFSHNILSYLGINR